MISPEPALQNPNSLHINPMVFCAIAIVDELRVKQRAQAPSFRGAKAY